MSSDTNPGSSVEQSGQTIRLDDQHEITQRQSIVLLISILIVALCGITYELIIGTAATYLLGNSVYQFSLTIGFFMFAMGLGSFLSRLFIDNLIRSFIVVEIVISIVGGISSLVLFVTFIWMHSLFIVVMYLFIIVIGSLVGLEIPILMRILSQKETIRKSISDVLSLDYIGALIGSIVFPLLLLPSLGLIKSTFVIGLINILTAIVNLYYFRAHRAVNKKIGALALATTITLFALVLLGTRLTSFAEHHLYQDQVIFQTHTLSQQRVVITREDASNKIRMFIDGHIQFSERDEYRYHEALVHPVMALPGPKKHVLILGGGDGLVAREVLKYKEVESIVLVDLDKEITDLATRFPFITKINKNSLKNPKVKVVNADAFNYLPKLKRTYDRVIIDMPDPHNEVLSKLYSREFYRLIKSRLSPHGIIISQSSSPFFVRRSYWSIAKTMEAAGYQTLSFHITVPSFGVWGFHIGSRFPIDINTMKFTVPMRFMSKSVLSAGTIFPKDIERVNGLVNTLLEPKIYMLYQDEVKK